MPKPMKKEFRYMPGLDGLRTVALIGVMSYHWNLGFAPGGFLGVSIFFVLSGYLITDILASQWRLNGRIDLKDFWYRRFRRLLPAMFTMLIIVVAWVTLFDHSRLSTLSEDVTAAITYISNWHFIYNQVSYFESFGPPSPLGHMWSLAVEEQFYLLWPVIMLIGLHVFPRRGQMLCFISVLAGISALMMTLIYEPGGDPSRVYFGTDTRAFGLLIGSTLAIIWPSFKLSSTVSPLVRIGLDTLGTAALLLVMYMMWKTDRYDATVYQGGMVVLSLATAVVVAVLAHPATWLGKIMGTKPLRWIGVRSYGLYLWHYPVLILTSPNGNPVGNNVLHTTLQVVASIILASLSWKVVEEPIRRGALKLLWQKIRHSQWSLMGPSLKSWVALSSTLLLIGICCAGMITSVSGATTVQESEAAIADVITPPVDSAVMPAEPSPPVPSPDLEKPVLEKPASADVIKGNSSSEQPVHSELKKTTGTPDNPQVPSSKPSEDAASKPEDQTPSASTSDKPLNGKSIVAIGDSVMVGVTPELQQRLPGIIVDAKIGRQMTQAKELIPGLKAKGQLNGVVIIGLGTNGSFASKDFMSLLDQLSSAEQVIIINTKVPRDWERNVNNMLAKISQRFPNTTLVDWHTASKDHAEYFISDGVHLSSEGIAAYSSLVVNAITK